MIDPFTKKDKERFNKVYNEIRSQILAGESGSERVDIDPTTKKKGKRPKY